MRLSSVIVLRRIVLTGLLLAAPCAEALTYTLASGNASWPADKRAAIIAAMDEAVAIYNANGYFNKTLWANYNASVPTAQASYSGWIDFGGSIGTSVALHEISHTLGVGTVSAWAPKVVSGKWTGPAALARVKLYDGASATLSCDSIHFWPYGMNYSYEDNATSRIRHPRMVSALRWDMGIVADSDGDAMPDDWETFNFGNLTAKASGDADGDGKSNLTEYQADTNPNNALTFTWIGTTDSTWSRTNNWSPTTIAAPTNAVYRHRLNVNNAANSELVYTAAQGTTRYASPADRGLVIGSGALGGGTMRITGGSFSTVGAAFADAIGNSGNTALLRIEGGVFTSDELQLGVAGTGTGTFQITGGTATFGTLHGAFANGGTGAIRLDGGTLAAETITAAGGGSHAIYFNGGTLKPRADRTDFLQNLTHAWVQTNGAAIDTAGYAVTIAQALKTTSSDGGLRKIGTGTLLLAGANTYTNRTLVEAGALLVATASGALGSTGGGTVVSSGASLALSNSVSYAVGEALTLSGAGVATPAAGLVAGSRGALQSVSGSNIWNGPITIAAATTRLGVQDGAQLTLTGTMTAPAGATVIFRAGTTPGSDIILVGTNRTWTVPSAVFSGSSTGGAVRLAATNALPTGAVLQVAGNGVAGLLDLNGFDQQAAGLAHNNTGASAIGSARIVNTGARRATLTLAPTAWQVYAGTIEGDIALVKTGGNVVQILSGTPSYEGDTTILVGTLALSNACLFVDSTVTIASGAKLSLRFADTNRVAALTLAGTDMPFGRYNAASHPTVFDNVGTLYVADEFYAWIDTFPGLTEEQKVREADPDNDGSSNLVEFYAGNDPTVPQAMPVYIWTNTVDAASSWTNDANWSTGTAPASHPGTQVSFFTGATFTNRAFIATNPAAEFALNTLTLGGVVSTGTSTVHLVGGTLCFGAYQDHAPEIALRGYTSNLIYTISHPIELATNITVNGANSGRYIFAGPIGGTGGLARIGTYSTVLLAASNTFSGTVGATGKPLVLAHPQALMNATLTNSLVSFDASAGQAFSVGALSGAIALVLQDTAARPIALTVGGNHASTTCSGTLSGTGSLVKTGSGRLTLSATQTFSGGLTIREGSVKLSGTKLLATGLSVEIASGAAWYLDGSSQTVGALTGAGLIDTTWAAAGTDTLTVGAGDVSSRFDGAIAAGNGTQTRAIALKKSGSGTFTLGGNNTYSGATTLQGGTLRLAVDAALPAASALSLGSGTVLDCGTTHQTVASLAAASGSVIQIAAAPDGDGGRLAFGGAPALAGLTVRLADPTRLDPRRTYTILSGTGAGIPMLEGPQMPWMLVNTGTSIELRTNRATLIQAF